MLKSTETMTGRLSNLWPWKKTINENIAESVSTTSQEDRLNRAISPYESMFFKIQSLLIWENNALSMMFVIGLNLLYWLVVTVEFKLYSVACLAMLIVFVYNLWVEEIWPEIRVPPQDPPDTEEWTPIHPSVLSAPEISHHLTEARRHLIALCEMCFTLRREQPALFCGMSCVVLSLLWLVGRTVPGVWLLYILMNAVLLLPGACIHLLPPDTMASVAEASKTFVGVFTSHATGGLTESQNDELILEESPETMALLSFSLESAVSAGTHGEEDDLSSLLPAGDLPMPDENGDSSTLNSFTPAFGTMPSHEDESLDGLELLASELEPTVPASSQDDEGIRFRARHFNGNDDSSSDEEGLGRGLNFPDPASVIAPTEPSSAPSLPTPLVELLSRAALENMASSVAQTLAGAVGSLTGAAQQPQQNLQYQQQRQLSSDDDDDDFEIIDQGDLPSIS